MLIKSMVLSACMMSILLPSCSQEEPMQYTDDGATTASTTTATTQVRRSFPWNVKLTTPDASALALYANAMAFSISLEECNATPDATVNESKAWIEIYEFDRNCLAKLTSFTLNDKIYTPKVGSEFDFWNAGDVATFEVSGATPADELKVTVVTTIVGPVVAAGAIHYRFSEITEDSTTTTLGEADVRRSASLTIDGHASPNFSINQVELVEITTDGRGEFRIQLECNEDVEDPNADGNYTCDDVPFTSIRMALVEDTYVGALSEANLIAIFSGGGKSIDMTANAFDKTEGTPALPHGGFITADTGDTDVMVLATGLSMHDHPHMIFALKAGPSYTYFYIDVTTITQSDDH